MNSIFTEEKIEKLPKHHVFSIEEKSNYHESLNLKESTHHLFDIKVSGENHIASKISNFKKIFVIMQIIGIIFSIISNILMFCSQYESIIIKIYINIKYKFNRFLERFLFSLSIRIRFANYILCCKERNN